MVAGGKNTAFISHRGLTRNRCGWQVGARGRHITLTCSSTWRACLQVVVPFDEVEGPGTPPAVAGSGPAAGGGNVTCPTGGCWTASLENVRAFMQHTLSYQVRPRPVYGSDGWRSASMEEPASNCHMRSATSAFALALALVGERTRAGMQGGFRPRTGEAPHRVQVAVGL